MKKIETSKIKAIFFDLDGTLYFKGQAIEGVANTLKELRERGFILRFLANMDSRTTEFLCNRLKGYGIEVSENEMFTSVTASVGFVKNQKAKSVFPLVADEIMSEYQELNINDEKADYVIIGDFSKKVTYEIMNKTFRLIDEGAEIIALQKGRFYYSDAGKNIDTGAFVQLFEYASGKTAKVMGKPNAEFFNIVLDELKLNADEVVMVGDDINTDILGANNLGAFSVLVKTGKYNDQKDQKTEIQPDLIIDSVASLLEYIE